MVHSKLDFNVMNKFILEFVSFNNFFFIHFYGVKRTRSLMKRLKNLAKRALTQTFENQKIFNFYFVLLSQWLDLFCCFYTLFQKFRALLDGFGQREFLFRLNQVHVHSCLFVHVAQLAADKTDLLTRQLH